VNLSHEEKQASGRQESEKAHASYTNCSYGETNPYRCKEIIVNSRCLAS